MPSRAPHPRQPCRHWPLAISTRESRRAARTADDRVSRAPEPGGGKLIEARQALAAARCVGHPGDQADMALPESVTQGRFGRIDIYRLTAEQNADAGGSDRSLGQ